MVLVKGTWARAREAFDGEEHVAEWLECRTAGVEAGA